MNGVTLFFLLVFAVGRAQCCLVTASPDERPIHRYFCENQGCAANLKSVYCNNTQLLMELDPVIPNCTGFPPINSVCKHDGRAFVSTYTDGSCEFEGEGHLASDKCQDNNTICAFGRVSSAAENDTQTRSSDNIGLIVGPSIAAAAVVVVVVLVIGLTLYFKTNICKKKTAGDVRYRGATRRE